MISDMTILASLVLVMASVFVLAAVIAFAFSERAAGMSALFFRRSIERSELQNTDLFVTADPIKLFWGNLAAFVVIVGAVELLVGSVLITAVVAGFVLFIPGLYWARLRKKRFKLIEAQLADAFMMLGSSLQSGASIGVALATVAEQSPVPFAQELRLVVRKTQVGISIDDALIQMEQRAPLDSLIMASSAIRISREVGGNLVETIFGIAETLRRKFTMEGKIDSLPAQGKAQGKFMAGLPILVGVGLSFLDPVSMSKLISTGIGNVVLGVIIAMQITGFIFINKVTNIDS